MKIEQLFAPDGVIAESRAGYELRSGQVRMAHLVEQALHADEILVVEAGTGIGKSFAYLVPTLLWCAEHEDERAVIATSAIPLQHQLLEKDIPFLTDILKLPITAAVLKGRSNYLCTRRLQQQLEAGPTLEPEAGEVLRKLNNWSLTTETGDRAELDWSVPAHMWSSICSTSETCLGYHCAFREACFVNRARKKAAEAQIIIVNHHLLFANLQVQQEDPESESLLPSFQRLIIDEAHNIERNAVSYYTRTYDGRQLFAQLHGLSHLHQGSQAGLIERLRPISAHPDLCNEIYKRIPALRAAADRFDHAVLETVSGAPGSHLISPESAGASRQWNQAGTELIELLSALSRDLNDVVSSCTQSQESISDLYEAQALVMNLLASAELLTRLIEFDLCDTHVYWMENWRSYGGAEHLSIRLTPLSFAEMLHDELFERYRTVVCTSATLTVKDSFAYWEKKVGLYGEEASRSFVKEIIPSPFDYRSRVMLAVAGKAPNPGDYQGYMAYSAEAIVAMVTSLEGGALVLFTSHAMMESIWMQIAGLLEEAGITVLKQGDYDRYKLMRVFIEHEHSVLFATQSFWEGIDAPGNTLRLLIICRLPFQSPADPLFAAKAAKLESEGKRSFFELSLPEAVIRLKQGYGRLMRTSSDRGVVCILDSRIVTKNYGRTIMQSLPETAVANGELPVLIERMESFFYQKKR